MRFCKELADKGGFDQLKGHQWVAWLSVVGSPAWLRLPLVAQGSTTLRTSYRLRDGVTEVFPKGFMFEPQSVDGGRVNPTVTNSINLDEVNAGARTSLSVWTGTAADMGVHNNCDGWNTADPASAYGLVGSTGDRASFTASSNHGAPACSTMHHVYCFEVRRP